MEVEGDARKLSEIGTYVIRGNGSTIIDVGKYLVIWRYVGGRWLIYRDVYDSSLETLATRGARIPHAAAATIITIY